MSLFLVVLAGSILALSNLALRKSIDGGRGPNGFLVFQMLSGCLFSIVLNPLPAGEYAFNAPIACFGMLSGVILACMLFFLGKALENGPPGFTFSILNAATVMPAILLALFLGDRHGFPYTVWHGLGTFFVLGGLFWAAKGVTELQDRKKWALFSCMMFLLHVVLLLLFQWKTFLVKVGSMSFQSKWFLPFMFLGAFLIQLAIYWRREKRKFELREASYGIIGGMINSIGMFFLLWAVEIASPLQNAVLFPVSAVITVILSNFWGQKIYSEQVNWKACQCCAFGLMIGTVDWKEFIAIIGF